MKLLRADNNNVRNEIAREFARLGWTHRDCSDTTIQRFVVVDNHKDTTSKAMRDRFNVQPNVRSANTVLMPIRSSVRRTLRKSSRPNLAVKIGLFAAFLGIVCGSVVYVAGDGNTSTPVVAHHVRIASIER
jgi:hypothetical protein